MPKTILVAETGADIPEDIAKRYGIHIVPMHVNFGNTSLPDGTFPVDTVYAHYQKTRTLPTTSGSTPDDFATVFDDIHAQYPDAQILYLAYSAVTTCSFQSAQIAAEGRNYVTSIDTKSVSIGQCAVVTRIAELLEKRPDLSMDALKDAASDLIQRVRMCFVPGDLSYLRAGGRVSNAQYLGAQILRLHPMIEIIGGKLVSTKKYRGHMAKVAGKLLREYATLEKLCRDSLHLIHSAPVEADVRESAESAARELGFERVTWLPTGCVVSTHCGPGAFGIVGFAQ